MLATNEQQIKQVISEAESIARGKKPEHAHDAVASGPATGTDAPGDAARPPGGSPAPSSPDVLELADLALILCDWPFLVYFGQAGQLPDPFRAEARKAWADVIVRYAPLIGEAGPFGALLSIYSLHTIGLVLSCRTPAPSPASSANAAAEKVAS